MGIDTKYIVVEDPAIHDRPQSEELKTVQSEYNCKRVVKRV